MFKLSHRLLYRMSSVAPPSIITPSLLSSLRQDPQLPKHTWYYITATTLSALNRPDEIPKIYEYALKYGVEGVEVEPDHEEKLKISRRLREALIKATAVGGVPKVVAIDISTDTQSNYSQDYQCFARTEGFDPGRTPR
jgi:hypothetical protein